MATEARGRVPVNVEPGGGPSPHSHRSEDEALYVLEGRWSSS